MACPPVVRALLERRPRIEVDRTPSAASHWGGRSALYIASREGHAEVVRLLLRAGASPDVARSDGVTPLLGAAHQGHTTVVRLLLQAGADPNKGVVMYGATPLLAAVIEEHRECAELLRVFGADPTPVLTSWRIESEALHAWLTCTAQSSGLVIAAGCRNSHDMRWLLTHGRADPGREPQGLLLSTAVTVGAWPDAPAVCPVTVDLARAAVLPWSPERHWLFSPGAREAVRAAWLCRQRMDTSGSKPDPDAQALPLLPIELWLTVLGWVRRSDFMAPGYEGGSGSKREATLRSEAFTVAIQHNSY